MSSSSKPSIKLSIEGTGEMFEIGCEVFSFLISRLNLEYLEENVKEELSKEKYSVVIIGEEAVKEFLRALVNGVDKRLLSFEGTTLNVFDAKAYLLQRLLWKKK